MIGYSHQFILIIYVKLFIFYVKKNIVGKFNIDQKKAFQSMILGYTFQLSLILI